MESSLLTEIKKNKSPSPGGTSIRRSLLVLCCAFLTLGLSSFYIISSQRLAHGPPLHGSIRILSLNVWGLPEELGSQDKKERIQRLTDRLYENPEFDLVFLQELWMPLDHDTISRGLQGIYIMTEFEDLNQCPRVMAPWKCSGLAVLSKFPFQEIEFHSFNVSGRPSKDFIDGENLVNKGMGRVRISLAHNVSVDFFLTHTIADAPVGQNYTNDDARLDQIGELMFNGVNPSEADLVILSGDLNTGPGSKPFDLIQRFMSNTALDIYKSLDALLDPRLSTYANPHNSWSWNEEKPIMFDYVFYRTKELGSFNAWTEVFYVPIFSFINEFAKKLSFSDHEGIITTIMYEQKSQ
uniref:sphingomyelin phosphodiesterase n=1 Tax=Caligus rogercresseyi TaxID=217165 RepID=C1BQU0_CALRO|nr:neutral sphingomyelinase [Caligus rogercresseyi]